MGWCDLEHLNELERLIDDIIKENRVLKVENEKLLRENQELRAENHRLEKLAEKYRQMVDTLLEKLRSSLEKWGEPHEAKGRTSIGRNGA